MSVGAFSSVEPRPSKAQTFWLQETVKLAVGATLPAGSVMVTVLVVVPVRPYSSRTVRVTV